MIKHTVSIFIADLGSFSKNQLALCAPWSDASPASRGSGGTPGRHALPASTSPGHVHCPLSLSVGSSALSWLPLPQSRPPTSLSKGLQGRQRPHRLLSAPSDPLTQMEARMLSLENKCDWACPLLTVASSLMLGPKFQLLSVAFKGSLSTACPSPRHSTACPAGPLLRLPPSVHSPFLSASAPALPRGASDPLCRARVPPLALSPCPGLSLHS